MTAGELKSAAIKLFGGAGYSRALASALKRSDTQIWRWLNGRTPIPGPVEAAINSLLREYETKQHSIVSYVTTQGQIKNEK